MSLTQELSSWLSPPALPDLAAHTPQPGDPAPSADPLAFPRADGRPAIVLFLRHCGCPFAEKAFRRLRATAATHPGVACIAVSHSATAHTARWVDAVGGVTDSSSSSSSRVAQSAVQVITDDSRSLYARWGLGTAGLMHVLSPSELLAVFTTAREGITNRPTESGNRWQMAGAWAVDSQGRVVWGGPAAAASDVPDFNEAVTALD